MNDPLLIIASKDNPDEPNRDRESIVCIVNLKSTKADHLATIKISSEEMMNGKGYDSNLFASYYKANVEALVREAVARDNAGDIGIYYKKIAQPYP